MDDAEVWNLGVESLPAVYVFEDWAGYVEVCRALAWEAGCSMRTLDRALCQ